MKRIIKNNKGVILLLTMFILTGILVVTLGAADIIFSGIKMNRLTGYSGVAFFAAEAGLERALWEARTWEYRGEPDPIPAVAPQLDLFNGSLAGNNSSYKIDFTASTPNIIFQSIGDYGGVKRSVESSYER